MIRSVRRAALVAALSTALVSVAPAASFGADDDHKASDRRAQARIADVDDVDLPTIGSCSLVVPATARVVQDYFQLPVRVTGGCAISDLPWAAWIIGSSDDPRDFIVFSGERSSVWELFNDTPLGVRTWRPDGAFNNPFTAQYTQNSPTTTVKVGSWASLTASRSGSKVTINTRAVRYATSLDRNIAWAGNPVTIQYRAKGASTWNTLRNATTNSAGAVQYSYTTSATREYRAVYAGTPYIWEATTPVASR